MTSQNPLKATHETSEDPFLLNCFLHIAGTGRIKPALGGNKRRYTDLVYVQQADCEFL